ARSGPAGRPSSPPRGRSAPTGTSGARARAASRAPRWCCKARTTAAPGAEHVVDVEAPAQARLERERTMRRAHEQFRAVGAQLVGLAADVGRGRLDAESQLGIETGAAGCVAVDGAGAPAVEEGGLYAEVLLEVAVEIEVVLREVREADRGKLLGHEP